MKRNTKSMLGVTLLEVMLVLAIAAMIIVMSIRYYQSATTSQQANAGMEELQAIIAAADNLAVGTGNYSSITTAQITAVVGANNMVSPTGGAITVTGAATTLTVNIPLSSGACATLVPRFTAGSTNNPNPKITTSTSCASTGSTTVAFVYTPAT